MKKILLSIFTILGLAASAQTLTYTNSSPAWGNAPYMTNQCDSTGITPGATGAGASWSFNISGLNSPKTYTTSNALPGVAAYPSANVSVYSSTTNVAFYNSDVNYLKYYGGNIAINGFNVVLTFNTPSIYAQYPMALNSSVSSSPSGSISINGAINGTFTGSASATASGTGTLTLPSRTFNDVVRVTTIQNLNATLSLGVGSINTVTDDYYSVSSSKTPIFSIQSSTISSTVGGTSTQTIVTVQPNYNVVGLNTLNKTDITLSVFPNPATNFVNFSTPSIDATKVIVIDINGKIIVSENMEAGKLKLNTSNFATGIYMYQIADKNNQILTTGKFNVSK